METFDVKEIGVPSKKAEKKDRNRRLRAEGQALVADAMTVLAAPSPVNGGDPNDDECFVCKDPGQLVCCDTCTRSFHLNCLGKQRLPRGRWSCPECVKEGRTARVVAEALPDKSVSPDLRQGEEGEERHKRKRKKREDGSCEVCGMRDENMEPCTACGLPYHLECLALKSIPDDWKCPVCIPYAKRRKLPKKSDKEKNKNYCQRCNAGGDLLCCDTCTNSLHLSCLGLRVVPDGDWSCPDCTGVCEVCLLQPVNDNDVVSCDRCWGVYHNACLLEEVKGHRTANYWRCNTCVRCPDEVDSVLTWRLAPIHPSIVEQRRKMRAKHARLQAHLKLKHDVEAKTRVLPAAFEIAGREPDAADATVVVPMFAGDITAGGDVPGDISAGTLGGRGGQPPTDSAAQQGVSDTAGTPDALPAPEGGAASAEGADTFAAGATGHHEDEGAHVMVDQRADEGAHGTDPPHADEGAGAGADVQVEDYEYYVHFAGRSHRGDAWVPMRWLGMMAYKKLEAFQRRFEGQEPPDVSIVVRPEWCNPERIVARRTRGRRNVEEYLVKWRGLGYEHCSWEEAHQSEDFLTPELVARFERAQSQALPSPSARSGRGQRFDRQPAFLPFALHDFQLEGINWLLDQWSARAHCILADDSGLGKTVQAAAFLHCVVERGCPGPFLVVAPPTRLPHWQSELEKWAPDFRVVVYHGSPEARAVISQHELVQNPGGPEGERRPRFDVLVLSYDMAVREAGVLSTFAWEVIVCDEGHKLKSSATRVYQALRRYRAQHRVLLTGTPVPDSLRELHGLLLFCDLTTVEIPAEFEAKHARGVDGDLRGELHARMLRRAAPDAAASLPPRARRVARVDLSAMQRSQYRDVLARSLLALTGESSARQAALNNVVRQLCKVCNHPYLLSGTEAAAASREEEVERLVSVSGKLVLVDKLLARLFDTGHRVLLFSHSSRMLDILQDLADARSWQYQRLDGTVHHVERQARIDSFNAPGSPHKLFLLATRTADPGAHLASADTVILYDPDWDAHAYDEAVARTHRVGQTRTLMVYELLARSTVEETMLHHARAETAGAPSEAELEAALRTGSEGLFLDVGPAAPPWDDEAVSHLLDRSGVEVEEHTVEHDADGDGHPIPAGYWETLLRARFAELEAEPPDKREPPSFNYAALPPMRARHLPDSDSDGARSRAKDTAHEGHPTGAEGQISPADGPAAVGNAQLGVRERTIPERYLRDPGGAELSSSPSPLPLPRKRKRRRGYDEDDDEAVPSSEDVDEADLLDLPARTKKRQKPKRAAPPVIVAALTERPAPAQLADRVTSTVVIGPDQPSLRTRIPGGVYLASRGPPQAATNAEPSPPPAPAAKAAPRPGPRGTPSAHAGPSPVADPSPRRSRRPAHAGPSPVASAASRRAASSVSSSAKDEEEARVKLTTVSVPAAQFDVSALSQYRMRIQTQLTEQRKRYGETYLSLKDDATYHCCFRGCPVRVRVNITNHIAAHEEVEGTVPMSAIVDVLPQWITTIARQRMSWIYSSIPFHTDRLCRCFFTGCTVIATPVSLVAHVLDHELRGDPPDPLVLFALDRGEIVRGAPWVPPSRPSPPSPAPSSPALRPQGSSVAGPPTSRPASMPTATASIVTAGPASAMMAAPRAPLIAPAAAEASPPLQKGMPAAGDGPSVFVHTLEQGVSTAAYQNLMTAFGRNPFPLPDDLRRFADAASLAYPFVLAWFARARELVQQQWLALHPGEVWPDGRFPVSSGWILVPPGYGGHQAAAPNPDVPATVPAPAMSVRTPAASPPVIRSPPTAPSGSAAPARAAGSERGALGEARLAVDAVAKQEYRESLECFARPATADAESTTGPTTVVAPVAAPTSPPQPTVNAPPAALAEPATPAAATTDASAKWRRLTRAQLEGVLLAWDVVVPEGASLDDLVALAVAHQPKAAA